jgi:tetratricopeptide (TPR) repeat protein
MKDEVTMRESRIKAKTLIAVSISATKRLSIMLFFTVCVIFAQAVSLEALCAQNNPYLKIALDAYNQKDYQSAAAYFRSAAEYEPRNYSILFYLAKSLALSGNYSEGMEEYLAAWRLSNRGVIAADNHLVPAKSSSADDWMTSQTTFEYLKSAVILNPKDQLLHYYLANWLALHGRHSEAMEQYREAYNLNQPGIVADYCVRAMAAYKGENTQAVKAKLDTSAAIDRAKAQIQHEGDTIGDEAYRSDLEAAYPASAPERQVQERIDSWRETIERMRNARSTSTNSSGVSESLPVYSEKDIKDAEQEAQTELARYTRYNISASDAANWDKKGAGMRQGRIRDTASGLMSQFSPDGRGFSLAPEGTDLFTRNYIYSPSLASKPEPNQEELVATQEKLVLDPHFRTTKNGKHVLPEPFAGKAGALPASDKVTQPINADLSVHGELLNRLRNGTR